MTKIINIGMVGHEFMGKAHSFGYTVLPLIFDLKAVPVLKVICGLGEERVLRQAAQRYGWQEYTTSWEEVVARQDIDLVDISSPGDTHKPIAVAAARAGKHVFCEKPLANSMAEAREMLAAVTEAGVKHMTAFCNRRAPGIALAKEPIEEGKLGEIYQWRATWLSEWPMAPTFPLVWRMRKEKAGFGALTDIGSHATDLACYLVGEIEQVVGMTATFVKERPLPDDPSRKGPVTVDDAALFLARFENGATGSFEVTRFAGGNKERLGFEINGSKGSLRFDLNRMNELQYFSFTDSPRVQGFRTIVVGHKQHPYGANWWPQGHAIGYGELFVNQAYELMSALAEERMPVPSFEDGVRCQAVLEAVARSVAEERWVSVKELLEGE